MAPPLLPSRELHYTKLGQLLEGVKRGTRFVPLSAAVVAADIGASPLSSPSKPRAPRPKPGPRDSGWRARVSLSVADDGAVKVHIDPFTVPVPGARRGRTVVVAAELAAAEPAAGVVKAPADTGAPAGPSGDAGGEQTAAAEAGAPEGSAGDAGGEDVAAAKVSAPEEPSTDAGSGEAVAADAQPTAPAPRVEPAAEGRAPPDSVSAGAALEESTDMPALAEVAAKPKLSPAEEEPASKESLADFPVHAAEDSSAMPEHSTSVPATEDGSISKDNPLTQAAGAPAGNKEAGVPEDSSASKEASLDKSAAAPVMGAEAAAPEDSAVSQAAAPERSAAASAGDLEAAGALHTPQETTQGERPGGVSPVAAPVHAGSAVAALDAPKAAGVAGPGEAAAQGAAAESPGGDAVQVGALQDAPAEPPAQHEEAPLQSGAGHAEQVPGGAGHAMHVPGGAEHEALAEPEPDALLLEAEPALAAAHPASPETEADQPPAGDTSEVSAEAVDEQALGLAVRSSAHHSSAAGEPLPSAGHTAGSAASTKDAAAASSALLAAAPLTSGAAPPSTGTAGGADAVSAAGGECASAEHSTEDLRDSADALAARGASAARAADMPARPDMAISEAHTCSFEASGAAGHAAGAKKVDEAARSHSSGAAASAAGGSGGNGNGSGSGSSVFGRIKAFVSGDKRGPALDASEELPALEPTAAKPAAPSPARAEPPAAAPEAAEGADSEPVAGRASVAEHAPAPAEPAAAEDHATVVRAMVARAMHSATAGDRA